MPVPTLSEGQSWLWTTFGLKIVLRIAISLERRWQLLGNAVRQKMSVSCAKADSNDCFWAEFNRLAGKLLNACR